jgi:hypothetical protein
MFLLNQSLIISKLDNTYALFQKKMTPEGIKPELQELTAILQDRLTNRVASLRKNKNTWDQAALADIDNRITQAASKSARIVEAENQEREAISARLTPSLDKLAWALSKEQPEVADNRSESIQHTASRRASEVEYTTVRKAAIDEPSNITRPTTSVVDNMLKSVAGFKKQEDNNGYEVI